MATSIGSRKSSLHKDRQYDFCIKFLKISGLRLPICRELSEGTGSSSNNLQKYCLKITLLHGTEQQNIGEFEVDGNESIINHQLLCQIAYGRPDKLHVYIDQNWSAGLSGHITVDLKEFFEDVNVEIHLEYPLFSSGASLARKTAKLEMSVLCSCPTKNSAFLDDVDSNQELMRFDDISMLRSSLDDPWYPLDLLDIERNHEAPSILLDSVLKQVTPANACLDKIDREIAMLKDMEGRYTSNTSTRPEVLAAVFFSAGMAFQRQVDDVNRYRMYRGMEDPLLLGENSTLLLEDVSPSSRSESSRNPEADSFCQSSSRSLVLSDRSSNNCSHGQACSEAATSFSGDMDDDESDRNYLDSLCLGDPEMPVTLLESKFESSKSESSPVGEPGTSNNTINLDDFETSSQANSRLSKHNVLNVVGSVLSAFTLSGLSGAGSRDSPSRGSKDEEVTVVGSMLGRQRVTSIRSIRKSNPGLGWLSNSIHSK